MLKEIDVKAGDITYGQRLELGEIFQNSETSDRQKYEQAILCVYGEKPNILNARQYVRLFNGIVEGLQHWTEIESKLLQYEPTSDERLAGVEQYQKAVGNLATLHSIARSFGQDPDTVWNWKYSKVFGILLNDLESHKYQQRLNKLISSKR